MSPSALTVRLARAGAVTLAALALCWVAILNGQPFFHPDTVGYVRGADVAMMKLLGPRFATPWVFQTPDDVQRRAAPAERGPAKPGYDDQEVMGGRSIYYGALASLGGRAGGFWLTAFVQALAVAWQVEILLRALRRTGLATYAAVVAVLTLVTSAPFFAAFLMPDLWVGCATTAVAGLFALSDRLSRLDALVLIAITVFAAMAHASAPPVIGGLALVGLVAWLVRGRSGPSPWLGLGGCAVALVAAVAGAAAFSAAVTHTAGKPPVTPPFLTARLVADGPGTRYVREHCADHPFVVCRFADRLPLDVDHFLWGVTDKDGVFLPASPPERRALGAEQGRFTLAVVRAYPFEEAKAAARNAALQTVDTELSDFGYKPSLRQGLTRELPPAPRARLSQTLAYREALPLTAFWVVQTTALALSLATLAWMAANPGARTGTAAAADRSAAWLFAALVVIGVLGNGVVCGVLSTLYGRYQARTVWAIPLAAALVIAVRRRGPGAQ
jgi:hypothetical protein